MMSFFSYFEGLIEKVRSNEVRAKLGLFSGVLLPGMLSVFGVITFLRLPQILGASGFYHFSLILLIGTLINLLTAFSISSTVSNFNMRQGGVYTLLSRCFGAEFGIALSLPIYLSQVINIAFCIIGLIEFFSFIIPEGSEFIVGVALLAILVFLSWIHERGLRILQMMILLGLFIAFVFVIRSIQGSFEVKSPTALTKPFWALFAAFFPAITGFESGLFTIDQLKNPKKTFPKGTISIVMFAFFIYLGFAYILSYNIDSIQLLTHEKILLSLVKPKWILVQALIGSTIFYALSCVINAPKLLQAMIHDAFSNTNFWSKLIRGKENVLAFSISILLASFFFGVFNLDLLAPLLTHFFLLSYAMVNLAYFFESFIQNPSFRPSFYVHYLYPLIGFLIASFAMVMIDPILSLLSWSFVILIYLSMRIKRFTQNYDDIRQSIFLYLCRFATYNLANFREFSSRSWRPQVICFSQNLTQMTPAISLAKALTQDKSFLIFASALKKDLEDEKLPKLKRVVRDFFIRHEIDAIIELVCGQSIDEFVIQMIKGYGLGPIKPNTVLFSYDLDRGSFHRFEEWMKIAEAGNKNGLILCYKEGIQRIEFTQYWLIRQAKRKKIEIYIENESKLEQYFLFIMASLLQKSEAYFKGEVLVVVIAKDEDAIESLQKYYSELFLEKRFDFDLVVKLNNENTQESVDICLMSYRDFTSQIPLATKIAERGGVTLLVHQREKLAFEHILD